MANQPTSVIPSLRLRVAACNACDAVKEAGHPTPFSGDGSSGVLFLLRNPGVQERDGGAPAIGQVREGVDELLHELDLTRENTVITNTINCYTTVPKPNRPPYPSEILTCTGMHLQPLLEAVQPGLVVTFGKEAFLVFAATKGFTTVRQHTGILRTLPFQGKEYRVFAMEHPAVPYLYDNRMMDVWQKDVRALKVVLKAFRAANKDPRFVDPFTPQF
jgi:uracil-DNA glycosylase family 4